VLSQQLQGQLQTQHSADTSNYIMEQHNINSKTNYRQALEKIHTEKKKIKKKINKRSDDDDDDDNYRNY
jgi:hypothetical protein